MALQRPEWLKPAPDSVVADNIKLGKWPWVDAVHLLWTVWVFITPMFGAGYTQRWALITLWSFPLFILFYLLTLTSARRHAPSAAGARAGSSARFPARRPAAYAGGSRCWRCR